jgi:hypothetical protein
MTKIPLIDLKAQYSTIRSEIREAIEQVMRSEPGSEKQFPIIARRVDDAGVALN